MRRAIRDIYRILHAEYGPRGWWPTTAAGAVRPAYSGGPRREVERLEIIVGAILTQNTSWKNVERALENLIAKNLLNVGKLQAVRLDELAETIRPSGYYNQKAIKLKAAADFLAEHPLKRLSRMPTADLRALLLSVRGVGPETADSILLYALGRPIFVIDAYTKRIASRLGLCSPTVDYHELQAMFQGNLPQDAPMFNQYHALLVEHGKNVCRTKPLCSGCSIRKLCRFKGQVSAGSNRPGQAARPAETSFRPGRRKRKPDA